MSWPGIFVTNLHFMLTCSLNQGSLSPPPSVSYLNQNTHCINIHRILHLRFSLKKKSTYNFGNRVVKSPSQTCKTEVSAQRRRLETRQSYHGEATKACSCCWRLCSSDPLQEIRTQLPKVKLGYWTPSFLLGHIPSLWIARQLKVLQRRWRLLPAPVQELPLGFSPSIPSRGRVCCMQWHS